MDLSKKDWSIQE